LRSMCLLFGMPEVKHRFALFPSKKHLLSMPRKLAMI